MEMAARRKTTYGKLALAGKEGNENEKNLLWPLLFVCFFFACVCERAIIIFRAFCSGYKKVFYQFKGKRMIIAFQSI